MESVNWVNPADLMLSKIEKKKKRKTISPIHAFNNSFRAVFSLRYKYSWEMNLEGDCRSKVMDFVLLCSIVHSRILKGSSNKWWPHWSLLIPGLLILFLLNQKKITIQWELIHIVILWGNMLSFRRDKLHPGKFKENATRNFNSQRWIFLYILKSKIPQLWRL